MACFKILLLLISLLGYISPERPTLNKILFDGHYEFIDLSYQFNENTMHWVGTKTFEFTKKNQNYQQDGSWYASNEYAAAEHSGTHIDAPQHFKIDGKYVGSIELERLIVPLIIVGISSRVNDDPNFVLHKHHLDYLLNDNNGEPCLIIFKFGWTKFAGDDKYLGKNKNGTLNFPGLSAEVAEWITTSYKNVVGIGVDVASVDPGSSKDFPVHKINANAGLYNIENIKMDKPVPEYGCTAFALPMKIELGSGAPIRLVAVCPKLEATHF